MSRAGVKPKVRCAIYCRKSSEEGLELGRGKRYCYYVSRRLVAESGKSDSHGWRLPAAALEGAVPD
jgi:hypothetical protein